MILPSQHIRSISPPIVSPFCERRLHQSSGMTYGLGPAGYDVRIEQHILLPPGAFALASTFERFHMPDDLIAFVHDKSTWARKGLAVQNTVIEPGWRGFLTAVESLPAGTLWRHNQAGDLVGDGFTLGPISLRQLVKANRGRLGFTYTHYKDPDSLRYIREANQNGFTVNLSADSLAEADRLKETGAGPVVVTMPPGWREKIKTEAGHTVIPCPAESREGVTCESCELCARPGREVIIGFPGHGTRKRFFMRAIP